MAINRSLRENVFGIFPCVMEQIPVLLCGKPGSSKTLACNLIFENCTKDLQDDPFIKKYPQICKVSYQGSIYSTTKAVEQAYAKA